MLFYVSLAVSYFLTFFLNFITYTLFFSEKKVMLKSQIIFFFSKFLILQLLCDINIL